MIKPEVLDAMVAAGCTAQQIAAAVKADQASSSGAARQARYRARKASQSDERDVTDVTVTGEVSPKKETSPAPLKEKTTPSLETANAVPQRKRATRLSADWQLPKAWGDEAVAEGLTPDEVRSQAETMRDWSLSAPNGAKLDWHAAWRIWFRKAIRDRPKQRGSPAPKASSTSALADSASRLVQSMRSADEIRSGSRGPSIPALIPHLSVR